jgi:hypothetical protein
VLAASSSHPPPVADPIALILLHADGAVADAFGGGMGPGQPRRPTRQRQLNRITVTVALFFALPPWRLPALD